MAIPNVLLSMQLSYNQLTRTEKKIADYVQKNAQKVLFMSITELAEECHVADASVHRFCRTIGAKGYQEFKMWLSINMGHEKGEEESEEEDGKEPIFQQVLKSHLEAINETNQLLDKEKVKYLTDNHISLILSLDGRKEMHDSMRPGVNNEGTYDRIMKNLQYCIKHRNGEEYYVRGTFTRQNLDFTTDVEDMLNHGFPAVSMEPVVGDDTADYSIKEADLPRVKDEYDKLAKFFIKREEEGNPFFFFHFNMDLWRGPCLPKRLRGCGAGHEYLAVVPNGDIYPCHQFVGREGYVIGNVFEGLKNMKMMRDFRVNHVFSKPECVDCWAKFFCSGGCHANNEAYAGDIHKPYGITCEIQKKRVECAIQAYNKLKAPKVMHQPGTKAARKAEGLSAT